jgi:site-specific DNA-methyltransferase (adenine-specific)
MFGDLRGVKTVSSIQLFNENAYTFQHPDLLRVKAIISDPPYGISYSPGFDKRGWTAKSFVGKNIVLGDDKPFDPTPFLHYPVQVFFGANHFADKLPASSNWIVWDKRDGITPNDFADCELIWTNQKGVARIFRHRWYGAIRDSEQGVERIHATQKPLVLMKYIIERLTQPNDLILDPFFGSGVTALACLATGRDFIGCELDPVIFAKAKARIAQAQQQGNLDLVF